MKILHVVPTYYPAVRYGGPIRSVHGLASALAAQGHDVHVYTTNVDGKGVCPFLLIGQRGLMVSPSAILQRAWAAAFIGHQRCVKRWPEYYQF